MTATLTGAPGFFRSSHGTFEACVGFLDEFNGFFGKVGAVLWDAVVSCFAVENVKFEVGFLLDCFEDFNGCLGDFWSDAVAFERDYTVSFSSFRVSSFGL